VQGLADAFILMRFPFESPEAQRLNQQIFETIYYGALEASCELAEQQGPYETYEGSPVSKGVSARKCPASGHLKYRLCDCLWALIQKERYD